MLRRSRCVQIFFKPHPHHNTPHHITKYGTKQKEIYIYIYIYIYIVQYTVHCTKHTTLREPLFATPCCNTSRATWSTPSEPSQMKPFFEVLSFSALFDPGCCCQHVCLNLVWFISVCPCIPETGRLENTYSCCVFWLWSGWLLLSTCLF